VDKSELYWFINQSIKSNILIPRARTETHNLKSPQNETIFFFGLKSPCEVTTDSLSPAHLPISHRKIYLTVIF
jgi:hypothetical protein